mmetsp:Transcript_8690/g.16400  ORF Transcript_8690/g.16400 Transcript_8690/m.16400 type:complete len:713 (-) Transcript_8690:265-2403(-)
MDVLKSKENIPKIKKVPSPIPDQTTSKQQSSSLASSPSGTSNGTGTNTGNNNHHAPPHYPKAQTFECDFDENPTKLYLSIQGKQWEEAISRAKAYPQESKTWVSRYEASGTLRWRLLPLHAAIIFKATEETILSLILSYPRAARHKDDQGMLPIHLAIRNMSSVKVVELLLVSYPEAANVQDRKGRLPLALVENMNCTLPLKTRYKEVIGSARIIHDVVCAAVESDMVHNFRKKAVTGSIECFDAEKINLMGKIDALEVELNKTQQARDILIGQVNNLQAKLSSKHDTENYLSTRITNIDSSLKKAVQDKEVIEAQCQSEKNRLEKENDKLKANIVDLEEKIQEMEHDMNKATVQAIETELSSKNHVVVGQMATLEEERNKFKDQVDELETLLQQKIASEHSLANQVSMLASQLAESTAGTCASTSTFQKRIETLVQEKKELQKNVDTLKVKVSSVLRTLNFMAKEHDRILRLSMSHQDTLQTAKKYQDSLAANAARSEQMLIDAAWEREEIVRILTRQAQEVEKSAEERKKLMEIVKEQNAKIDQVFANRSQLVGSIHNQKGRMERLKDDIRGLREIASDDVSLYSEDSDDVNTVTPTIVRDGKTVESQDDDQVQDLLFDPLNDSSIQTSDDDDSCRDDGSNGRYHLNDDGENSCQDTLPHSSTLTTSVEEASNDKENDDDDDIADPETESSVDMLCNHAARLVASMPAKK